MMHHRVCSLLTLHGPASPPEQHYSNSLLSHQPCSGGCCRSAGTSRNPQCHVGMHQKIPIRSCLQAAQPPPTQEMTGWAQGWPGEPRHKPALGSEDPFQDEGPQEEQPAAGTAARTALSSAKRTATPRHDAHREIMRRAASDLC